MGVSAAIYRRGPGWLEGVPLGEQPSVEGHMAFVTQLVREGTVERAGPFHKPSDIVPHETVGLLIFALEAEEARRRLEADPSLEAGTMRCDVFPWYA